MQIVIILIKQPVLIYTLIDINNKLNLLNMNKSVQDDEINAASKAIKRYRRVKTIANKAVETADICGLLISILVYDPKLHRCKEIYTSRSIKLEALQELAHDQITTCKSKKKCRPLKFQSIDARTSLNDDNDYDLPAPFMGTLEVFNSKNIDVSLP